MQQSLGTRELGADCERLLVECEDTTRTLNRWLDHAPGFIALLRGSDYMFEMANRAFYQLVGHRELLGKPLLETLPDIRGQGFEQLLNRAFATGERYVGRGMCLMLQRTPGEPPVQAFVDFVYEPVFSADGSVSHIFVEGHEVTEQQHTMLALRASEERYRSLFESIDEGFCVIEVLFDDRQQPIDCRFLEANPAFERQTGLVNVVGSTMRALAPTFEQHWFEAYGRVALTGKPIRIEQVSKALADRWYEAHAFRVGAPDEHKVAVLFKDITDRKRGDDAWRTSQERFKRIFSHAAVGIAVVDLQGRFLHTNDAHRSITGYSEQELRSRTFLDITFGEDRATNQAQLARLLAGEIDDFVIEKRFVHKDGHLVWVRNSVTLVPDSTVAAGTIVAIVEDITERRQAEQALRRSEERLRLAVEAVDLGTFDHNPQTGESWWSPRMRALYGFSAHEPLRREQLVARIHPDDREQHAQAFARALDPAGGGRYCCQYRIVVDGTVRWISITGGVSFETREQRRVPVRVTGVALDVTEQHRLVDSLREADQRKDEFLAMLAHELRNPLAPMTNALRLLERSASLTEVDRRLLAVAERQRAQLARLVNDLLEVSRITCGKIELRCEPMSVQAAVYNAVESVSTLVEQRNQKVQVDLPREPSRIVADPARIAQILENLLTNASKYTGAGGSIRIEVDDRPDGIEIRVIDNGIGIDPAKISRLFELFSQIDPTIDRAQGGLGIGLALVKRLAELHGGHVRAESAGLGTGSTFTVGLPRKPRSQSKAS